MANGTDADFLQVLLCQVREDPLVDFVVAECRLVFFEAQAPQPDHDVHDGTPNQGCPSSWSCPKRVSS
jgi:rubredoxin